MSDENAMKQKFIADVFTNRNNVQILDRWSELQLPDGWLVAGCLFQTVWNRLSGRLPDAGIKDYDIFYYDSSDLSAGGEKAIQQRAEDLFSDLNIKLELCNQARVHHWYEEHFGHPYPRLASSKDGIDRFLVPCTCVGINAHEVYAPYGFELLYAGELSMNSLTPHQTLYEKKASSYQERWPWLHRTEQTHVRAT